MISAHDISGRQSVRRTSTISGNQVRCRSAADANATLTITKQPFLKIMTGGVKLKELLLGDELKTSGSIVDLARFFSLFDKAAGTFPIVTP
jgi:alkyl sulfatase BDS1-like metallo-beta-lactamase superfamily hydrolase